MLKDITIGQYYPASSPLHRLDPRAKILLTLVYIILLFFIQNIIGYACAILFTLFLYLLGRVKIRMILKSCKPIIPILIITGILNLLFVSEGEMLVHFWIFSITTDGIALAITMAMRILLLISGASLLTYTTLPIALTDGIEALLRPLQKIHFPSHELAMMMTIALRFIPTLIEETDKIMAAQKARGATMDAGSLIQRGKAFLPILIPLFISSFRRAEDLAMAMEARCYRSGIGRTRLKELKIQAKDIAAIFIMILFCVSLFFCNWLGGFCFGW